MRRALILLPLVVVSLLSGVASAAPAPPPTEKLALLIGIDRFQGATRPNFGGAGDVSDMRELLIRSGWAPGNIRVLTDEGARAADIRSGLRWLVDRSSPTSFSVVHYSGHTQQSGSTEYLWPHDNQLIPDTELAASLRQLRGKAWIDISGCEAAGFVQDGLASPERLVTASSQATEKSYEWVEMRRSLFTYFLVQRGMLAGEADANRDKLVSVQEVFAYAADRAPRFSAGQAQGAQHPFIAGGDGAPLFLHDAMPAPAAPTASTRRCFLIFCSSG